ncbi:MAG: ABC transporter permease [Halanaerobiales bacterium]|nr:ABC transporter permease [Halanaerobiales bacterium]
MLKQYLNNTKTLTLSFLRNKETIFFVLLLPFLFMLIFGSLYSGSDQSQPDRLLIYYSDQATIEQDKLEEVINENQSLTFQYVSSLEVGEELLRNYEAEALLIVGDNSLEFAFNPARIQDNPALEQQAYSIAREINLRENNLNEYLETVIIDTESATTAPAAGSTQFLSLFPGLIALGLASSGLFVIVEVFIYYKEKGVLKRMAAAPINKNAFVLALITSRMPASILSMFLILAASRIIFGVSFAINWLLFIPYIFIGTVIMMGFGALITLFFKTADSAFQAASILLTIMIFFSGIYFPIEFLPSYFQSLSRFLPLTYLARGLQQIMGVSQLKPFNLALETGGLLILSIILIIIVAKKSRWAAK